MNKEIEQAKLQHLYHDKLMDMIRRCYPEDKVTLMEALGLMKVLVGACAALLGNIEIRSQSQKFGMEFMEALQLDVLAQQELQESPEVEDRN